MGKVKLRQNQVKVGPESKAERSLGLTFFDPDPTTKATTEYPPDKKLFSLKLGFILMFKMPVSCSF